MVAAPPATLLLAAHFTNLLNHSELSVYTLLIFAWSAAIAAIALSGWPLTARLIVGVVNTALAVFTLPFLALLAICTTGNCI